MMNNSWVSLLVLVPTVGLLTSCATRANYQKAVNSWNGQSSIALTSIWGYPDRIEQLPKQHKLYVYIKDSRGRFPQIVTPGYTTVSVSKGQTSVYAEPTTITGGGSYHLHCRTWFELDHQNKVIHTYFRGNDCSATSDFVHRYSASVSH